MRRLLIAPPALLLLALGCVAKPAPRPYSPDEERPRVAAEARWWEEQGDKELVRAKNAESLAQKERCYAVAIHDLRSARDLYYEELEALENADAADVQRMRGYPAIQWASGGPVPAGRREALEIEIDRLTGEIAQLVRERPIEPPVPPSLSDRLTPR